MNLTSLSGLSAMIGPASASAATDAARLRQDAKVKDARAALETLKQRKTSADEDQKAAAKQKIEQLKARIRMMRMTMPADPKAAARMASQLARELGAAVKAYAAAGGSTAGMGETSTPSQAAAGPADADAEAAAGDAQAPANAAAPGAETASQDTVPEGTDAAAGKPADGAPTASDPYRQVLAQQQAQAADRAREAGDKQADSEFMTEVKRLANELKSLLHQAARAAKQNGDDLSATDEREVDKAMAAMDQEIADAEQAVSGGGISLVV